MKFINLIILILISQAVHSQELNKYMFVNAKSGLNYRAKPKGEILGKFPYKRKVFVVEDTNIIEDINDNGKIITGNWFGVKIKNRIVYIFSAYLVSKIDEFDNEINVGSTEKYLKTKKLQFEKINEKEYFTINSSIYIEKIELEKDKNFFYIPTSSKKVKFKHYKNYGGEESWNGFNCKGYYPKLRMYAIEENLVSDCLGFGVLYLFDNKNYCYYEIESIGDGSVSVPIPSINNKFVVYYYCSPYDESSEIRVLKINDKSRPINYFKEYATFSSNNFNIEEIKWKNEEVFVVKTYDKFKTYKYYKCNVNKK